MPTLLLMWGLIRGPLWKIQGCVWHTGNAGKHSPPLTFISLQPLRWREIIIIHPLRCCLTCGCYSVQFRCSGMSDSLRPHGLQHTRLRCPWPTPTLCSNSRPLSRWCQPTISSSVVPFSSNLQSSPASRSFLVSQFFALGGQRIGVSASASVLPMNIQDWFPLGWTSWISLLSKGLSGVFSNTTVQKHQFFTTQLSL